MIKPTTKLICCIVLSIAIWLYAQFYNRDVYIAVAAIVLVGGVLFFKLDKVVRLLRDNNSDSNI